MESTQVSQTKKKAEISEEVKKMYSVDLQSLRDKITELEEVGTNIGAAIVTNMKQGMQYAPDQYKRQPILCTAQEAASHMVGKKNIVIITGAGLSAASGIPTFRGDNGFWKQSYGGVTDPTEILTYRFFMKNPQLVWQWHFDFIELAEKCKPNAGHHALLKFQEYCAKSQGKINSYLITQNIDDYDAQLIRGSQILNFISTEVEGSEKFAFTNKVLEMHGNVKYMHCSNESEEHSRQFYIVPTLDKVEDRTNHVPKCKICDYPMKPHAMFFDECYNEHYYRQNTIQDIEYDTMDCLIVVGTALATSGARSIVFRTLNRQDIPVIEMNLEPQCNVSYALQVTEKCETALPKFFDQYYQLSNPTKPKTLGSLKPATVGSSGGKFSPSGGKPQVKAVSGAKPMTSAKPIIKK